MNQPKHNNNRIGVAVDVGTTTIVVCCINLLDKKEICTFSFANPQHIYGADVVTRIRHCVDDKDKVVEMQTMLEKALHENLREYLRKDYDHIRRIVYSGNTVMLHILRGLSLDGLAYAPFEPIDINYYENKVFLSRENSDIQTKDFEVVNCYLPSLSAFVGADILAGTHFLQMGQQQSYDLLIDLGTNGELLLLNKEKGYATSTACGPVFDHVIGGAKYGSESMQVIANCVKRGLIDQTGKLVDAFFEKGISINQNFTVKQEHIRNFQLAKGAIRAGIECLLKRAGITAQDISTVYISGGLGFYMNSKDAFTLKMFPQEFADKIVVCDNTSLEGAKQMLHMEQDDVLCLLEEYRKICNRTECFELANYEDFQECYMKSLNF